jgi:hypothetical protein
MQVTLVWCLPSSAPAVNFAATRHGVLQKVLFCITIADACTERILMPLCSAWGRAAHLLDLLVGQGTVGMIASTRS